MVENAKIQKIEFTNAEAYENMMVCSQAKETGVLGYAIARNRRKLYDATLEYSRARDELLPKYGKEVKNGVYEIDLESKKKMEQELEPIANIQIEIDLVCVSDEVFCSGSLNSQQMYALDCMIN